MSLEAHHRFILDTMQRNQDIARNIINELEAENARIKAEVERLIKAGDAMHKSMLECGPNEMAEEFDHDRWWATYYGWNAAKEGNQP
jgi:hypothetical protein